MTVMEVLEGLLHPDEKVRNRAIELVRTNVDTTITIWIVDELIKRLQFSREPETAYAQQAIVALGGEAINQVSINLLTSQSVPMQLGLARILTEIGLRVAPQDGPDVFLGLLATANTSRSEDVIDACMQGIVRIRWPEFSQEKVREAARHARMCLVRSDVDLVAAAFSVT